MLDIGQQVLHCPSPLYPIVKGQGQTSDGTSTNRRCATPFDIHGMWQDNGGILGLDIVGNIHHRGEQTRQSRMKLPPSKELKGIVRE